MEAYIVSDLDSHIKQTLGRSESKVLSIESFYKDEQDLPYNDKFEFRIYRKLPSNNKYRQFTKIIGLKAFCDWLATLGLYLCDKQYQTNDKKWLTNNTIYFNNLRSSKSTHPTVINEIANFFKTNPTVSNKSRKSIASLLSIAKCIKFYSNYEYIGLAGILDQNLDLLAEVKLLIDESESPDFYQTLVKIKQKIEQSGSSKQIKSTTLLFYLSVKLDRINDALAFFEKEMIPLFRLYTQSLDDYFFGMDEAVNKHLRSAYSFLSDTLEFTSADMTTSFACMLHRLGASHSAEFLRVILSNCDPKNAPEYLCQTLIKVLEYAEASDNDALYKEMALLLIPTAFPSLYDTLEIDKSEPFQLQSSAIRVCIAEIAKIQHKYIGLDSRGKWFVIDDNRPETNASVASYFGALSQYLGCPSIPTDQLFHPVACALRTYTKRAKLALDLQLAAEEVIRNAELSDALSLVHNEAMLDALLDVHTDMTPMDVIRHTRSELVRNLALRKLGK